MAGKREGLQRAKNIKNDEFYTQYADIAAECGCYLSQLRGRTIYCNCDTDNSNFVRYFKELKAMGWIKDILWSGGLGGLDFRSASAVRMLQQADIVVSNPPFSLFREYITQLIDHDKRFLIIGNQNAVSYKWLFPLFMAGKIRIGYRPFGMMLFDVPVHETGKTYKIIDGVPKAVISALWFTNLETPERPVLNLHRTYHGNEAQYPKYDNLDAINVNRICDIPADYWGLIGVPITFLGKYNPAQFVLMGQDTDLTSNQDRCTINGNRLYARIILRRNTVANGNISLTALAA